MNGKERPVLIALVVLVVMILIGGVVFAVSTMFNDNKKTATAATEQTNQLLLKPKEKTTVRMAVRGPIIAKEKHYDIDVSVSAGHRKLVVFNSYDNNKELAKIELDNSEGSFKDFTQALYNAGFLNNSTAEQARGVCPNGQLINYIVEIEGQEKYKAWSTSCKQQGSFAGQGDKVVGLMLNQIPNGKDTIHRVQQDLMRKK